MNYILFPFSWVDSHNNSYQYTTAIGVNCSYYIIKAIIFSFHFSHIEKSYLVFSVMAVGLNKIQIDGHLNSFYSKS